MVEDPSQWSTGARMERYLVEALPLGKDAVSAALGQAGVAAQRRRPARGLLLHRLRDAGAGHPARPRPRPAARRPAGLRRAHGLLRRAARPRRGGATTSRCTAGRRCCSASSCRACTCNRPLWTRSRWSRTRCSPTRPRPSCWCRADPGRGWPRSPSLTDTTTADHMTWHVTDLGFRMGLSPRVPDVLVAPRAAAGRPAAGPARAGRGRRRRLGGAPGRAADPRRGRPSSSGLPPAALAAVPGRRWPSTATARRRPC